MDIDNIISYITSSELQRILFPIRVVFIAFSLFFLISIIYFLFKTTFIKKLFLQDLVEFLTFRGYAEQKISKQWSKIKRRLEKAREAEYKLAIIEADNLLQGSLKRIGYLGDTLGEQLKILDKETIPNLDSLVEAHRIRNNIVHDPDYRLSLDQTERALRIYEKTFQDLQVF